MASAESEGAILTTDRIAPWIRKTIIERERTKDAHALAKACATLNGHGGTVFGMMISTSLPDVDQLRDEALAALQRLLPELTEQTAEGVFRAIERGQLPIELGAVRARFAAKQQTVLTEALAALRKAARDRGPRELAEFWGTLGYQPVVIGVELPLNAEARLAAREVVRQMIEERLLEASDHDWPRVAATIRAWRIPIPDVEARTAEVMGRRARERGVQLARYVDGEPYHDDLEHAIATAPDDRHTYEVYADWLVEHEHPRGELMALQLRDDPALQPAIDAHLAAHAEMLLGPLVGHQRVHDDSDRPAFTWRRGFIHHARLSNFCERGDQPTESVEEILELLVGHPSGRFLAALDLGFDGEPADDPLLDAVIQKIAALRPPHLRELLLGDFTYDKWPMSAFDVGSLVPLWGSPLRKLVVHGATFTLGAIDLPEVERVEIKTGSLQLAELGAIAAARWPRLRFLDVWTGNPNYGGNTTLDDLAPLFARTDLAELTHLGIMNCAYTDELCERIATLPLAHQLRELDLSLGTMSDRGARARAAAAPSRPARASVNVSQSWVTDDGLAALRRAFPTVIATELHRGGNRFVAVGE